MSPEPSKGAKRRKKKGTVFSGGLKAYMDELRGRIYPKVCYYLSMS